MKINKNQLQKALTTVQPGLASKDVIEQTTSFAFLDGKVVTYNDQISISHPVEGLDIRGALPSEELYKLLQRINNDEIDIEVDGNQVSLKFGKGHAHLTLQTEIKIPLIEIKSDLKKLPKSFNHLTKLAMASCSRDMSQPRLTCINIQKDGILQATDSYRIIYCDLEEKMPIETFLFSASSAKEAIKINPTHVAKDKEWIHFKNGEGTTISCRLNEFKEEYPDLKKHFDIEGGKFIEFPEATREMLERAQIFAARDNQFDEEITISIQSKKLTISSKSETGKFSEKTLIRYEGDPIEFIIPPYLLVDILKETNKCELGENTIKFEGEGWQYVSVLQSKEE